jgi:hypothetical protein
MKKLILMSFVAVIFFGCKHDKSVYRNPEFVKAENAAAKIAVVADSCSCISQAQITACVGNTTQAQVINQYLNNQASVTKTITWGNCTTAGGTVNDPNCNTPYQNTTSQITLCWHSCTSVTAKFTGKPPCLPCYPEAFCMILTPQKQVSGGTTTYVLTGSTSVFDVVQIKLVISTDPDVLVQCAVGPAGNQTIYTCYGSY